MKWVSYLIFFSIVLLIHSLVNFYIYRKILLVFSPQTAARTIAQSIFWVSVLSYFSGRILEKIQLSFFSDLLIWIGAIWFAYMLYLSLTFGLLDIVKLANNYLGFLPGSANGNISAFYQITGKILFSGVTLLVLAGFINSRSIIDKGIDITINKSAHNLSELRIVMFSDLHLGSMIGKKYAAKVVERVNKQNPDIVLIPGDLIDEDIEPVLKDGICEELQKLSAKYGVYATTGNHEYIGDAEKAVAYLEKNNIKVLRDTSVLIDSSFYLVGREDRDMSRFAGRIRKTLPDLMQEVDKAFPVILMDHQPFHLEQAEKAGVDLQLSGHTHHGQLFPLNYITEKVYEVSWGYKTKGNTHYYVSCGVGGWGPPARIGSRPEIVTLNLKFAE